MDMRETTELGNALGSILEEIKVEEKIQITLEKYLYKTEEKIAIPVLLWYIIVYLNEELKNKIKLDYSEDVVDCNTECRFKNINKMCWSEEKLVFVKTSDMHINITDEPKKKIECSKQNVSDTDLLICAFFLRACLYKYTPRIRCYVPKEFFRWSMFVFFLHSFDAFCVCFEYCIQNENKSLNKVFRDILELILWLQNLFDNKSDNEYKNKTDGKCDDKTCGTSCNKFKEAIRKEDAEELEEVMGFISWVFRGSVSMGNICYEALNSRMTVFLDSMMMKKQKEELVRLIKNNEKKTDEILGGKLRKKMVHELDKNWLEY